MEYILHIMLLFQLCQPLLKENGYGQNTTLGKEGVNKINSCRTDCTSCFPLHSYFTVCGELISMEEVWRYGTKKYEIQRSEFHNPKLSKLP